MDQPDSPFILVIDEGTTSTRVSLLDRSGAVFRGADMPITQVYPRPGWVEQDPEEIWAKTAACVKETLESSPARGRVIAAIGITNQRETTIVWERATGKPVCNAIVWQCRRSAAICERMRAAGHEEAFSSATGLVLDPYFSGTKIRWILDEVQGAKEAAEAGGVLFGSVDSWLLWNLTGGAVHSTDHTNASRTLLFNIATLEWDPDLLEILGIPRSMMPRVMPSSCVVGRTRGLGFLPDGIPIAGVVGDQQAALFGQLCCEPGSTKNTYGTGCFLLMNTGRRRLRSRNGLITTLCASLSHEADYALEGSVFMGGAVVQWLRDQMGLIRESRESEAVAMSVPDTGGVCFVPAFVGLGAPYWDARARGLVVGLTQGTGRAHVVRAALESICHQTSDVVSAMEEDSRLSIRELRVDGGAAANAWLMQFQADILGVPVMRPGELETTSAGAGYVAGLAVGLWDSVAELKKLERPYRTFQPSMREEERAEARRRWARAVSRSRDWE